MTQQRRLGAAECLLAPALSNSGGGWSILNTPVPSHHRRGGVSAEGGILSAHREGTG
jgi:hypothetical protein